MSSGVLIPKPCAPEISPITREDRIIHFEGIQPKFKQSPPIKCFSIKATFNPKSRPTDPAATTNPAVPAPITTKS